MRVIYIDAEQGHAVPRQVMPALGPFAAYEPRISDPETVPDFPPGATAQNGMVEIDFYTCRRCDATVRETGLETHKCEE